MPSFTSRIGKHSNRSRDALASVPEPSTSSTSAGAGASGASTTSSGLPPLPPLPSLSSSQQQPTASTGPGIALGRARPLSVQVQQQNPASLSASSPSAAQAQVQAQAQASPQAPAAALGAAPLAQQPLAQQAQAQAPPLAPQAPNTTNTASNLILNTNTNHSSLQAQSQSQDPHSASPSALGQDRDSSFDHIQQQHNLHQQRLIQQQQDTPPRPPPHDYDNPAIATVGRRASQPLHHHPGAYDPRQRSQQQQQQQQQDYIDPVSRSQSQRYSIGAPFHIHPQYTGAASSSVDDLHNSNHYPPQSNNSAAQGHLPPQTQTQNTEQTKSRSSARRLIKNIFSGKDHPPQQQQQQQQQPPPQQQLPPHHQQQQQQQQEHSSLLGRRPSKRVRDPPTITTGPSQVSQLSLDQPSDWQFHTADAQQPSPLQALGDSEDQYYGRDSNRDPFVQVQDPRDANRNSIRYVQNQGQNQNDQDSASYEESSFQQTHSQLLQQQVHPQLQQDQQQQYGQAYDSPPQQQQQYQRADQPRGPSHFPGSLPPIVTTSTPGGLLIAGQQHQNPETISQLSHESPATDSDARSAHHQQSTQASPAVNYLQAQDTSPLPPSSATASPQHQQQHNNMAPGAPPSDRRTQPSEKSLRSQMDQSGVPPGYRHSQPPGPPAGASMNSLRGGAGQDRPPPQFEAQTSELQGRSSPQPSNPDRDANDPDKFKELLTKYKNVKRLFFDGKGQIELLNGQIEQLQNAVANQRITQSRTALDDGEYLTRFSRLNGAINNLSFNVRKDWKTLPPWLSRYVSQDALKTGKQEMMAVGRAVITRWLVEEIFNKCFHPGLSFELSRQLKDIERNIRHASYTISAQEEFDALTNKVISWRMATLDGLQPLLNSQQSAEYRNDFTRMCTTNLTATLFQHLIDPPPQGVDGSTTTIVELAVGLAANLPLESRDVAITYPLPGDIVNPNIMELEKAALPPLENSPEAELADEDDGDVDKGKSRSDKARGAPANKDIQKVRLAGFLAVEVRSRQVLLKAPVWTLG